MKKRTGAASFYIVMFSTLLLTVIVIAFTTSVISETNRTVDNDLSQSAYDSALAGIEDAKLAIAKWKDCQGKNDTTCNNIKDYMNKASTDCDSVARILGRINPNSNNNDSGTFIQETTGNDDANGMTQAYTCVLLNSTMYDYRANLTSEKMTHIVPLKVADANSVKSIRISWYSDTDGTVLNHQNVTASGAVNFPQLLSKQIATPPAISVQLIQTPEKFTIADLDAVSGGQTNRGFLYFAPSNVQLGNEDPKSRNANGKETSVDAMDYYDITATYGSDKTNILMRNDSMNFVSSNRNESKNVPIAVYCPQNSGAEFACSVSIELPEPVGENRNSDTFMIAISLLYGRPDTDFSIEVCSKDKCLPMQNPQDTNGHIPFEDAQISIDSTGRANDLYRRVEARVENIDPYFPVPTYAVQLNGKEASMRKDLTSSAKSDTGSRRSGEDY